MIIVVLSFALISTSIVSSFNVESSFSSRVTRHWKLNRDPYKTVIHGHQADREADQGTVSSITTLTPILDSAKGLVVTSILFLSLSGIPFNSFNPLMTALPAWADEYGKETEAPTFFTGENVMICTKRGPLGACLETAPRTATNDNDKASKYFGDPTASLKDKYRAAQLRIVDEETSSSNEVSEGNLLIQKLKQQSVDNKEKNDRIVRQKTLQNDLGASFSPLDSEVVVVNADGDTYTVLTESQATRLKQAGYLKGGRFVSQPTQEVIDAAASDDGADGFFGGLLKGIFGAN